MTVRRKPLPICPACGIRGAISRSGLCWECHSIEEQRKDAAWVREQRLKAEDEARRVPDGWPPYAG